MTNSDNKETNIISEIEKAIDEGAVQYYGSEARGQFTDYHAGAQFILPLLKKAIEQRDIVMSHVDWGSFLYDLEKDKSKHNLELLKLLGRET